MSEAPKSRPSWQDQLPQSPQQMSEMMGGPRGILDAGIPGILFAIVYGLNGQDLDSALWAAIGCGVLLFVVSLLQRRSVQHSIGGLVGVGIMAFVASRTGRAEDFFLPSVLKNAAYASAYLVSILVRWPLIGVLLGFVLGEGTSWRQDPVRRKVYTQASWVWVGVFGLRVAVQLPLYLAGAVTALGIVNIPLGIPLFAAGAWLTWLLVKRVPTTKPHPAEDSGEAVQLSDESRHP